MNSDSPITPPPELVEQWADVSARTCRENGTYAQHEFALATQAARWAADQELEACLDQIYKGVGLRLIPYGSHRELLCSDLRAARRPKPPSLKEQAKFAVAVLRSPDETCSIAELQQHWHTICNALEQLDD